ncbi:MAG TPA: zf-HC2 domain-containing protein, partial [Armatimonadota bacterium]
MICREVVMMLSEYVDGELSFSDTALVEEHLRECSACRTEFEQIRSLAGVLASTPEIEPPAFLLAQIEAATINRPTTVTRLRQVLEQFGRVPQTVRWAAAFSAAVLAAAFLLVHPANHQSKSLPVIASGPSATHVSSPNSQIPTKAVVARQKADSVSASSVASTPTLSAPVEKHHSAVHRTYHHVNRVVVARANSAKRDKSPDAIRVPQVVKPLKHSADSTSGVSVASNDGEITTAENSIPAKSDGTQVASTSSSIQQI